jgi:hypothetical protein
LAGRPRQNLPELRQRVTGIGFHTARQGGNREGDGMFSDLEIWLNHFEYHAEHPRCIPAGLADVLKPEERQLIARSIATFQLAEQSEGVALLRAARRLADRHNCAALVRITELFIREEQRHAALLRAFMEDHAIALKHTDWTDFAFCCLRRFGGFELRLHVLITAELIGNVYYRALEVATGCQRLKILCRTLVADELAHVGFESQLLLALRARRPAPVRLGIRLLHRTFFAGAAGVMWLTQRAVLRNAGYGIVSFLRVCAAQYTFYLEVPAVKVTVSRSRADFK